MAAPSVSSVPDEARHEAAHACMLAPAAPFEGGAGAACATQAAPPQAGDRFGGSFALSKPVALAQAVASIDPQAGPTQVEGIVDAVCQKRGCWMVLRDADVRARVLMKDHAFSVPIESRGRRARVEGELRERVFNAAQVEHLEKDAGRSGAAVKGSRREFVLTATAVEFHD